MAYYISHSSRQVVVGVTFNRIFVVLFPFVTPSILVNLVFKQVWLALLKQPMPLDKKTLCKVT